jgi:23S rRNA (uracil1939-C5)-methyltransferase
MIELTITSLSHAGEGIGRDAGRAIFVPFALPGERVRVEIVEERKNFSRADLIEVLKPSPERTAPRCPHHFALPGSSPHPDPLPFGARACGGCQLQHLVYPAQLAFKQETVIEQLTRVGGFAEPPVRAILPAPDLFGYRNQMQFALAPEGRLGLRASRSEVVIPIRECHIAAPALMELFGHIRIESAPELEYVTLRAGAEDELIVFEAAGDAPEVELDLPVSAALLRPGGESFALANRSYLIESVKGRAFRVSAGSFFQVNTAVAELLVEQVLSALALRGGETVLDLYCGVGLFSAFIAPLAARVVGVESFEAAVDDAAVNLDEFDNIEIYAAPAEEVLPGLEVRADAVVLDPPRAGCALEVIDALIQLRAPRLVYVSCDPAAFARDAGRLCAGGYALDWVQPLDMFPQTYHVECVGLFVRN